MGSEGGAISTTFDSTVSNEIAVSSNTGVQVAYTLNASGSSSVYSGTTVQPPSCQTLMIIRV